MKSYTYLLPLLLFSANLVIAQEGKIATSTTTQPTASALIDHPATTTAEVKQAIQAKIAEQKPLTTEEPLIKKSEQPTEEKSALSKGISLGNSPESDEDDDFDEDFDDEDEEEIVIQQEDLEFPDLFEETEVSEELGE